MIDIHVHILPGLDDGPHTWEEALEMARVAAADGITAVVATPHLFQQRGVYQGEMNRPERILPAIKQFQQKLTEAGINLHIFSGCEAPLFPELLELLQKGSVLTINNGKRHLCLELPETVIPPATEDIVFQLSALGITPIITHPERNLAFQEMPQKFVRLVQLGCLAQITATSLVGGFGRRVAKFSEQLVNKGYIHLMASDAHDAQHRRPVLSGALKKLTRLVGESRAWDMVSTTPEKILRGEPVL